MTFKEKEDRFAFGKNWLSFLNSLDAGRIELAEKHLKKVIDYNGCIQSKKFIDVGSGSGLFSLAAHRLGFEVRSFDYDLQSVEATRLIKKRFGNKNKPWHVEQGSILDENYINTLGKFDIVYSWGVLHHTGNMSVAIKNALKLVDENGKFVLALYNDQGMPSAIWKFIKFLYVRRSKVEKKIIVLLCLLRLWGPTTIKDIVRGKPFDTWKNYRNKSTRGMDAMHDVIDWVGGYPFEVVSREKLIAEMSGYGFEIEKIRSVGKGHGCNEFVFKRAAKVMLNVE
jgi:SAM-dependent methyltransferase